MSELTPQIVGKAPTPLLDKFPHLFKNRNFLLLWAAYVISALGDRVHYMVMLKLLAGMEHLDRPGTQEAAQLNVMMLLPFLLIGPFAGVIADRLPRRLIMVFSDFSRVVIVVVARTLFLNPPHGLAHAISWWPQITYIVFLLLLSELCIGGFSALFSPARNAILPNLVHPTQLLRANSMTNAAGTIASLLGYAAGGALVVYQLNVALYVDAATFLCSGLLILAMRRTAGVAVLTVSKARRSGVAREFGDALRYLRIHAHALQVILLIFLFWCAGAVILSGLTGIVTHKFGMHENGLGNFFSVVGIGMMFGAASVSLARGIAKEIGIAWSMTLVGVFLLMFSIPRTWPWALAFLVIAAFFGAVLLVSLETLLQRIVPDFIRGRVMAAKDMLANVGLVGVAVPLAINPDIDNYIMLVLRIVAILTCLVGLWLVVLYYRSGRLPTAVAVMGRFAKAYLSIWHRFRVGNAARIPLQGPVIVVANHTTPYDPIVLQTSSRHRQIQFMMAKEYYQVKPFYWFYKWLKVIPVNRTGNDTASFRTALRSLKEGACIGMFPEGRISDDGRMNEGRPGVALLALMSGATVVPAYIRGTLPYGGMLKDFLRRANVTIFYGRPLRLDDIKGHDDAARDLATQRIMAAIRALRDRYETDPQRRMSAEEAKEKSKS